MRRPRPFLLATAVELAKLERSASRAPRAVAEDQRSRLEATRALARRAPFWRAFLDGDPAAFVDKTALRVVPQVDLLTAPPPPGTRTVRTSGSTGEPIAVLYPPGGAWIQGVLALRMIRHMGLRPWDRHATATVLTEPAASSGVVGAIRSWRAVELPADASPEDLVERVRRAKPRSITGNAQLLMAHGEALSGWVAPKAVMTNGDTLTTEHRAALKRLYGVEPIDVYGTTECGIVAWQCREADLYHVNHEAVVVEIFDDAGRPVPPGETGHVQLTSLWNALMPYLSYRIGDSAAWANRPCRCGSSLPALTHITGRTFDWIVDGHGRRVTPHRMMVSAHLGVEALAGIRRYAIRQNSDRSVRVDIISTGGFTADHADQLQRSYGRLLGGEVPVEVRLVDQLDVVPGTKFQTVRSEAVS